MTTLESEIIALAKRGVGVSKIAMSLNTTPVRVYSVLGRNGWAGVILKPPSERQQKIIDAYKSGMTLEAVGEKFGVTRERVRQIVTKFGHSDGAHRMTLRRIENAKKQAEALAARKHRMEDRANRKAAVLQAYRDGMKLGDISERFGYACNAHVNSTLRRWGEPARRRPHTSERMKEAHARRVFFKKER